MSHPFVERLIGSVRRELLDHTFFWTATDLENKLQNYQCYYNESRTHSGRDGVTPVENSGNTVVDISRYRWKKLIATNAMEMGNGKWEMGNARKKLQGVVS